MTATYSYKTINIPDTANPNGINDSSVVVGDYFNTSTFTEVGFLYSNNTLTTLTGPTGAANFTASGINDGGEVLGYVLSGADQSTATSYLYESGTYTLFNGPAGSTSTWALGISNNGNVAGYFTSSGGDQEGFVDIGGTFTTLSAPVGTANLQIASINDSGEAVGNYETSADSEVWASFIDDNGQVTTLTGPAGATSVQATGINDAGQVVGTYEMNGNSWGFVYSDGTYTTLSGPKGSTSTFAYAINKNGAVVGFAETKESVAFIATPPTTKPKKTKEPGPAITAVSSSPSSGGMLAIGGALVVHVDFNDTPLELNGTPELKLGSLVATYDSGSSDLTDGVLTFDYAVASGVKRTTLKISSLTLPSGTTLTDTNGDKASLKMTTQEKDIGVIVDGTPPTIKSVKASPTKNIVNGDTVTLTLKMSEDVTVTGTPSLELSDGGTANYASGSDSETLVFTYHVGPEGSTDLRIDGISESAGNTIEDLAGNELSSSYTRDLKLKVNDTATAPAQGADLALFVNSIAGFAPDTAHATTAPAQEMQANQSLTLSQPHT